MRWMTLLLLALLTLAALPAAARPSTLTQAKQQQAEARSLIDAGRYDAAITSAEKALATRRRAHRGKHPDVAESLDTLGEALIHKSDLSRAEKVLSDARTMRVALFGEEHPDVAATLDKLAALELYAGRFGRAEQLYQRTLAIRDKALGPDHALVAETLGNLGALYYHQARYAEAEATFRRALQATERALGPQAKQIASIASNLGSLYSKLGRLDEAEASYRRAIELQHKHLGRSHPDYASTLNKLGALALRKSDLVGATKLLEETLAILEQALGASHRQVGVAAANLAEVYERRGDLPRAKKLLARAYGILKRLGDSHPLALQALHNYALMLAHTGDPRAEQLLLRLVELRLGAMAKGDVRAADTLLAVAQLALPIRKFDRARLLADAVLDVVRAKLGEHHILVAQALAVRGEALAGEGELGQAVATFREAVSVAERAYGPRHPELARILMKAAAGAALHGRGGDAVALAGRAADIDERNIREVLAAGSEAQKRAYASVNARHAHRVVQLHREQLASHGGARRLAMLAILRHKGRVLDVLVDGLGALRRRLTPEDGALLDELSEVRSQIAMAMVEAPSDVQRSKLEAAEKLAAELEQQISERSDAFRAERAPITLDAVQAQIPEGAALVELFQWRPQRDYRAEPERYLAYVLKRSGEPQWVELGSAQTIDALATAWREALADPSRDDHRKLGRQLDRRVMEPIRRLVGHSRQLIVSPDGALNLVPFGALVDERDRYLIEDRAVSYVTSGRDLLRLPSSSPARSGDVIIANPNFGQPAPPKQSGGALAKAVFAPLPGTGQEAQALATLLPDAAVSAGSEATKKSLFDLRGPRLLHIATHGFFLGGTKSGAKATRALELVETAAPSEAPLQLSGLAFAGANQRDGSGVLTALEAATLDLWGTKLVVLSACETGLGSIESGEGVSGLRRALWTAGAESAVMSLWKVDDQATRDLMIEMYGQLAAKGGRAESLRRAQLSIMADGTHGHPFYWASFIPVGDFRTLSGARPAMRFDAAEVEPGPRGCACRAAGSPGPPPAALLMLVALAIGCLVTRRRGHRGATGPLRRQSIRAPKTR